MDVNDVRTFFLPLTMLKYCLSQSWYFSVRAGNHSMRVDWLLPGYGDQLYPLRSWQFPYMRLFFESLHEARVVTSLLTDVDPTHTLAISVMNMKLSVPGIVGYANDNATHGYLWRLPDSDPWGLSKYLTLLLFQAGMFPVINDSVVVIERNVFLSEIDLNPVHGLVYWPLITQLYEGMK